MTDIVTLLPALAECVRAQMEEADLPGTCFTGVVPGDAVLADYGGDCDDACGIAWVRMATMYPSVTVGEQDSTLGNCGAGLGADVEVGVLRCVPMDEEPPNEEEAASTVDLQMRDMMALRRAIVCCDALPGKDYILGSFRPLGPSGGLTGGFWTVYVAVD